MGLLTADAEKKAAETKAAASAELKKANAFKSKAASEMKKAKDLYHQQANLNGLYRQAVSDRDGYKAKADKADELAVDVEAACKIIGAMAKAVTSLLFDPAVKIDSLTPVQERVLQAIQNYAAAWAETAGFTVVADDIRKHYGFTNGIQKHIDELTPKRHKSYDRGL